jgi:glycosyltransferase involved in cell wall biosynthesis
VSDGVLLVLTNYMRPQNLPKCIRAWKGQTVQPQTVVVVDNSPAPGLNPVEEYPSALLEGADDIWRFRQNLGPSCRFAPALLLTGYTYILFADDDLLPGPKALAYLLETARSLKNRFSTLGARGRVFELSRNSDSVHRPAIVTRERYTPSHCDLTIRAHLVLAEYLPQILSYRQALIRSYGAEAETLAELHDDFVLCMGIQRASRLPSYVTPEEPESKQKLIMHNVDRALHALHNRSGFAAERSRMIEMALRVGWTRPW